MATAEASQASLGPRFAPEDPMLPQPWKGLIDGSTGNLYYWNPETNVTQYERPAAAPPLPPGLPPTGSTPKLAPIPVARTLLPNGNLQSQLSQQVHQQSAQQAQQQQPNQQVSFQPSGQHAGLQQTHQMPYQQAPQVQVQLHNQQYPQMQVQQHNQQYPQMQVQQHNQQYPQMYTQVPYLHGHQLMLHPQGQPLQGPQAPFQQAPYEQTQQLQEPTVMHHQGQQLQGEQRSHQQGQHQQGPQTTNLQTHQSMFPRVEESVREEVTRSGFSLPLVQQPGGMPSDHHHLQSAPPHISTTRPIVQPPDRVGSQHTGSPSIHLPTAGTDTSYRQRQIGSPVISNQMGQSMVHPPMGLKLGYEEDEHDRMMNELHSSRAEVMNLQQPKPTALHVARSQQDMKMAPMNLQDMPPAHTGGLNMVPGNATPNLYNHATVILRPSPQMLDSSDYANISKADAYRQSHEVTATGGNVPAPFMTFEATGFPPEILREMQLAGFSSPTPIQAQTWPIALQSRDIVAIAKTGSGKTLGYLIPAFIHLRRSRNSPQLGPTILVLSPTRELATQIQVEAIKFGRSSRFSCTCLYGGAPKGPQIREVERGADIIVATPGRLNDILEMKKINFRQVSFLVLDEADRMLDMGFEPQIRKIVNEIPARRQTLMYTATWPKEVRKIAGDLLVDPVQVNIGNVDELAANKSITQYVEVVPPMDKQRRLEQILMSQERGSKIIIFCSTKRLCDQLAHGIGRTFGAAAIHGDKSQGERDHVLNQFRSGKTPILVATDVAARGLDIKDIRVVINYDFPNGVEDYVHRIGRTGRAGATGIAYTFLSDQDWKFAADLVKLLEGASQVVPPEVREMAARGGPLFTRARGGMSRMDSGGGRWDSGGGRGMRNGGSGFIGGRDSGRGASGFSGPRDGSRGGSGFSGPRDGGDGGNGFSGARDRGGFGGRGGRNDFGGRGSRGRGFGGPGGRVGLGHQDRGPYDRYNNMNERGRFDNRRIMDRSRDRSYSRSPERVRTWGYDRSRSRSRSRSWSRSRSRSWSRSSRSRSRSYDRVERPRARNFSHTPVAASNFSHPTAGTETMPPAYEGAVVSRFDRPPPDILPTSPGRRNSAFSKDKLADQLAGPDAGNLVFPESVVPEPGQRPIPEP